MNILIIRIGSIGDTVVALPAIYAIIEKHPDANIHFLCDNQGQTNAGDIVAQLNITKKIYYYKKTEHKLGLIKLLSTIRELRGNSYDFVYHLSVERAYIGFIRDNIVIKHIIKPKYYFTSKGLVTGKISNVYRGEIILPEWKRLLKMVNPHSAYTEFRYCPSTVVMQDVELILKKRKIFSPYNMVAISVGSNMNAKQWPIENYISLVSYLNNKYSDYIIAFVGGPSDFYTAQKVSEYLKVPKFVNLCGELSVIETAAFLTLCKLHIGNDSGPMHLASMVGIRCISIYSARDAIGKWNTLSNNNIQLRSEVNCSMCMLTDCKNSNLCLTNISVKMVTNILEKVLN